MDANNEFTVKDLRSALNEPTASIWTDYELQKMIDYFGKEFIVSVVMRKIFQDTRIERLQEKIEELQDRIDQMILDAH
jgi:hypothetical protein